MRVRELFLISLVAGCGSGFAFAGGLTNSKAVLSAKTSK